jgi:hypothetical protein
MRKKENSWLQTRVLISLQRVRLGSLTTMQEFSQLLNCTPTNVAYDDVAQASMCPRPQTERVCLACKRGHRKFELRCLPKDEDRHEVTLITEYEVGARFLMEVGNASSYEGEG